MRPLATHPAVQASIGAGVILTAGALLGASYGWLWTTWATLSLVAVATTAAHQRA